MPLASSDDLPASAEPPPDACADPLDASEQPEVQKPVKPDMPGDDTVDKGDAECPVGVMPDSFQPALELTCEMTSSSFVLPTSGCYELVRKLEHDNLPVWHSAAGFWLYSEGGIWNVNRTEPAAQSVSAQKQQSLVASEPHDGRLPHACVDVKWHHISGAEVRITVNAVCGPATPPSSDAGDRRFSSADIAGMEPEGQMDALGEELYNRVLEQQPESEEFVGRVVGMLLDGGLAEALPLLDCPQLFGVKVQEAVAVLRVYEKTCEVEELKRSGEQELQKAEADAARLRRSLRHLQRKLCEERELRKLSERELQRRVDFPRCPNALSLAELRETEDRASEYVRTLQREQHDRLICRICMDKAAAVVLLPCKHQVLCGGCGSRVDRCPICMQDVLDRFVPFHA
eukprot:Hpha_TRINITY_DN15362_c0_g1::TRINITY_DN15362_c0_g1_i2::g.87519::m.87519